MRPANLLPASLLAAALALPCAAPARANLLVTIDKSTQRMSVAVDGGTRYVWPISTGRPGYDTPTGTFRPFRMEADHFSKEWDDAPMPHSVFFTKIGHAIHGSLDVRHLGTAASHGCVRLSPEHAATLYELVKAEGLNETTVVVAGQTPAVAAPEVAQRRTPVQPVAGEPMEIAPGYDQQPAAYYRQQPAPYYGQQQQPYYGQQQQSYYGQQQSYYGQQPQPQAYYRQQPQPLYAQQPASAQPTYALPAQPPPPQLFLLRPFPSN